MAQPQGIHEDSYMRKQQGINEVATPTT